MRCLGQRLPGSNQEECQRLSLCRHRGLRRRLWGENNAELRDVHVYHGWPGLMPQPGEKMHQAISQ